MKHLLVLLVSFCLLLSDSFSVLGETGKPKEDLSLYAQSAVLIDGDSGRVLYGKNELIQRPMASTTKIMTCILALENGNLEDKVLISSYAARQPKVHLGLKAKEEIYLKDLLYSLMLESHNDSAVAIAEHLGGSVEGFAGMMNQKARDLGCNDTYFITPNGLDGSITDSEGIERIHSTTAVDLARIMKYCTAESPKKEEFLKITQTQNYSFSNISGKRSFSCVNHNAFLTMMSGVLSGKTGFTGGAGYCYIVALEDEGRIFVAALLGCGWPPHKSYKWSDTRDLLNYGKSHYQYRDVFETKEFSAIPVLNGIPESGDLSEESWTGAGFKMEEDMGLKLLLREDEKVEVTYTIPEQLQAPVKKGDAIGKVVYTLENQIVCSYPVLADKSVAEINLPWCFRYVWQAFFL